MKLYEFYYNRQCNKYCITLPLTSVIGPGLIFPHNGPIVINSSAILGDYCMIHPNVLIGGNRKSGSPIIGNRVFIGNGSKIIGKVKIGNNVFISPGAMITKDVSDDAIVGYGLNNLLHSTGGETEVNRYISTID